MNKTKRKKNIINNKRNNRINKKISKTFEEGSKIYVLGVYVLMPIVITIIAYFMLYNYLIYYISSVNIVGSSFENSKYTIERIFTPFISCLVLIISLLTVGGIIKIINFFFKNKFSIKFARKIIFYGSISVLLLSAITFFYTRANTFEYWNYGIKNTSTEMIYIPLVQRPSVHGGNITSDAAPLLYRIIHFFANLFKEMGDKYDLIISMSGAILIPLKIEINKHDLDE